MCVKDIFADFCGAEAAAGPVGLAEAAEKVIPASQSGPPALKRGFILNDLTARLNRRALPEPFREASFSAASERRAFPESVSLSSLR
jgi:hypothetical protein